MITLKQAGETSENKHLFDLTDRGLLLADGVFDTSRVVRGRIIQKRSHFARLLSDAAALGIAVRIEDVDALAEAAVPEGGDGALRLTVTRGPGGRGLSGETGGEPTIMARFSPMNPVFPMPPVSLWTSTIRRNPTSPSARHKTLSYTDNVMALREAVAMGHDEALMLSPEGRVACASAANVFALFGKQLVTPPLSEGVLPGVIRGWLLEVASEAGLSALEESLTPERLAQADRIFLTNSLRVFQPVRAYFGRELEADLPPALIGLGERLLEGSFDD